MRDQSLLDPHIHVTQRMESTCVQLVAIHLALAATENYQRMLSIRMEAEDATKFAGSASIHHVLHVGKRALKSGHHTQ